MIALVGYPRFSPVSMTAPRRSTRPPPAGLFANTQFDGSAVPNLRMGPMPLGPYLRVRDGGDRAFETLAAEHIVDTDSPSPGGLVRRQGKAPNAGSAVDGEICRVFGDNRSVGCNRLDMDHPAIGGGMYWAGRDGERGHRAKPYMRRPRDETSGSTWGAIAINAGVTASSLSAM